METFFSNILVPVDFSANTEVAIEKAMWLAVPGFSIIHLLHVQKPISKRNYHVRKMSTPLLEPRTYSAEDAEVKLQQLKTKIQFSLHSVVPHVVKEENVQNGITC